MAIVTTTLTGIKPFWSYDSFNIANRDLGGGTGFINTSGGQVDVDTGTGDTDIVEEMNLVFMVNDLILKHHNNSPYITRFYNSTAALNGDYFNNHYGFMGKWWIHNYEHCLIEIDANNVVEIDPSGARILYINPTSGVYQSPNGILKTLTKTGSVFDLKDRSGRKWHFETLGGSDTASLFRLIYVADRNDIRVYVEWEDVEVEPVGPTDKWRISSISVSTNQGTDKITFIEFTHEIKTVTNGGTNYYHLVKTMKDYVGDTWVYDYDADGQLISVTYPNELGILRYEYSGNSELTAAIDMRGTEWSISYGSPGQVSIDVGGTSHTISYVFTAGAPSGGNQTITCLKTDEDSKTWQYDHTFAYASVQPGNLTGFFIPTNIGPPSYPYRFTWTKNQLTKLELPQAIKDSSGAYRAYTYLPGGVGGDPVGGSPPASTNNGLGNLVVSRFYDGSSYLEQYRVDYNFDSGDLLQWEGKDLQSGSYPSAVYFTKTKYEYDANGNLARTISGINEAASPPEEPEDASLDLIEQYEYDAYGNIIKIITPGEHTNTMAYESYGALVEIKDPLEYLTRMTWDNRHLYLKTLEDQEGNISTFDFDLLGQIKDSTDPLNNTTSYRYDSNGNRIQRIEPMGNTSTSVFDEKNRLIYTSSPTGINVDYSYNKINLTKVERYHDGDTISTDFIYDDSRRLIEAQYTVTEDGAPVVKHIYFEYDADSLITKFTDQDGNETTYSYNKYGQIQEIITPPVLYTSGSPPLYHRQKLNNYYNGPMGNMDRILKTYQTDVIPTFPSPTTVGTEGEVYDYDRIGRLIIRETSPDWDFVTEADLVDGDVKFRYTSFLNADGLLRVTEKSTWSWNDTSEEWEYVSSNSDYYEYDERGDLIKETHPRDADSTEDKDSYETTYEYNPRRLRVKSSVSGQVTRIYGYDPAGRLSSSTSVSDLGRISNQFEYDKNGNNIAVTDGNGIRTEYSYDSENRLVGMTNGLLTVADSLASALRQDTTSGIAPDTASFQSVRTVSRSYYTDSGWLKRITYPNGDYTQYMYDELGRIIAVFEETGNSPSKSPALSSTGLTINYLTGSYQFDPPSGPTFVDAVETVEYVVIGSPANPYKQAFSTDENGKIRYYHFYKDNNNPTYYEYEYDSFGNLTKIIKPDTNKMEYRYDKLNRMTKEILDPENAPNYNDYNDFTYDCCRLVDFTQTEGGTTLPSHDFEYDLTGRLMKETYKWLSDASGPTISSHDFEYSYDQAGRRVRMSDPYWSTLMSGQNSVPWFNHYKYDGIGRLQMTDRSRELNQSLAGGGNRKRPWAGETFLRATGGEIYKTEYDPGGRPVRITYPGEFSEAALSVTYSYYNDNQVKSIVAWDLTGDEPEEIYVIEYGYDRKGRRTVQTVWDSRDDAWPQYSASYSYDGRDQLTKETYLKYNATNNKMEFWRGREYTFDNGGSMTNKKILEGSDWVNYAISYSRGYHMISWTITASSGTPGSAIPFAYDANGNMITHPSISITGGGPSQFDLSHTLFSYTRKNQLKTYRFGLGTTYTLYWDAMGRIREKTWTADSTDYHQVFYHDGRTLVQIWNQDDADPNDVTRSIGYDLYRGSTGYLGDIDFEDDPDVESYLIKDDQGTIRSVVKLSYSGGSYTVTVGRYVTDAYGAWMNPASIPSDVHYMRYISSRVEGYGDEANQNQALIHLDHRHYLPYLGIFLQREPKLIHVSLSKLSRIAKSPLHACPYRYAQNVPISASDPSGRDPSSYADCIESGAWVNCQNARETCARNCEAAYSHNKENLDYCSGEALKRYNLQKDQYAKDAQQCAAKCSREYFWCTAATLVAVGIGLIWCTRRYHTCMMDCLDDWIRKVENARKTLHSCLALINCWRRINYHQRERCYCKCQTIYCDCMVAEGCLERCPPGIPEIGRDNWNEYQMGLYGLKREQNEGSIKLGTQKIIEACCMAGKDPGPFADKCDPLGSNGCCAHDFAIEATGTGSLTQFQTGDPGSGACK